MIFLHWKIVSFAIPPPRSTYRAHKGGSTKICKMKTIENREDVSLLVHSFYAKIRKHDILGPIFNRSIPDDRWSAHLEKLTDFWESHLFGVAKFRGSPPIAHQRMDIKERNTINQTHFEIWLQLWFQTLDELFKGERAEDAKERARQMSIGLFAAIWQRRPENLRPIN